MQCHPQCRMCVIAFVSDVILWAAMKPMLKVKSVHLQKLHLFQMKLA